MSDELPSGVDFEAEYDNRARVPEHPAIFAAWARDAAAYRAERPPTTVPYGPSERQRFDVFEAGHCPAVLFVHGGYWQALDRSWFSWTARGLNGRGVSVAVAEYDLCPNVTVGRIVEQIRGACAALFGLTGRPVVVVGHSAGGHLAACMLATDWRAVGGRLPQSLVPAAYAISGLFDLRPLVRTRVNLALGLDEAEALRLSPLFTPPAVPGLRIDAVVGAAESGEYVRQSRALADRWAVAGAQTQFRTVPRADHFTAIAPLNDPASLMCGRIHELAEST